MLLSVRVGCSSDKYLLEYMRVKIIEKSLISDKF
jgi:hypothetical protein